MIREEKECIEFLRNRETPENDLCGWIDCAGTLLLIEALPELTSILLDERRSFATRAHAARTIRNLGTLDVSKFRNGALSDLNSLLDIVEHG